MANQLQLMLAFGFLAFLAACGGSSNSSTQPMNDQISLGAEPSSSAEGSPTPPMSVGNSSGEILIAGLWNVSEVDGSGQLDTRFALISNDGLITDYDYDQDSFGTGMNCYYISAGELIAEGNNQYNRSDDQGGFYSFTAIKTGNNLVVTYIDVDDDNSNGSNSDIITETFTEVVNHDQSVFNECDDSSLSESADSSGIAVEAEPDESNSILNQAVFASRCVNFEIRPVDETTPGNEFEIATGKSLWAVNSCSYFVRFGLCYTGRGAISVGTGSSTCGRSVSVPGANGLMSFNGLDARIDADESVLLVRSWSDNVALIYGACGQQPSGREPLVHLTNLDPPRYACR